MSDENALRAGGDDGVLEAAERMWHLRRALGAAFFLAFIALVAGLAVHETGYDVYLDATLGRIIASDGLGAQSGIAQSVRPGAPRIGWLWQLVAAGLWRIGGAGAVTVVTAFLIAGGFAVILAQASKRLNVVVAGALLLPGAYLARLYMTPDGQAAGVFLLGALLALLANGVTSPGRRIWFAPALMVLWVNLDFTWTAGGALVAAFIVIAAFSRVPRRTEKMLALAAALAATLLNPDFHRVYEVLRLPFPVESPQAWIAPVAGPALRRVAPLIGLMAAGVLLSVASASRAAVAAAAAAVFMAIANLAVGAFPVAALAAGAAIVLSLAPFISRVLGGVKGEGGRKLCAWLLPLVLKDADESLQPPPVSELSAPACEGDAFLRRRVYGLGAVLAGAGLLVVFALIAWTVLGSRTYKFGVGAASALMPDKAVAFAAENGLSGVALVHPKWAGYFLASTWPRSRLIYDPRVLATDRQSADLAGEAFAEDAKRPAEDVARALNAAGMRFAVVPREWTRSRDMARFWTPVYWDDRSAVFMPNLKENAEFILAHDQRLTFPPYFLFGVSEERLPDIVAALERKVAEDPDSAYAEYELGMAMYLRKEYVAAATHILLALGNDPSLASAYHTLGDIVRATRKEEIARAAMAVISGSSLMREALASVPREEDGAYDAVAAALYTQATALDPNLAMAHVRLGNIYLARGQLARGLGALNAARDADRRRPQLDAIRPGLAVELDRQIAVVSGAFTQRRPGAPAIGATGAVPAIEATAEALQPPAESPMLTGPAGLEGGSR